MSARELTSPDTIWGGSMHGVGAHIGLLLPVSPCVAYSPVRLSTGSSAFLVTRMLMSSTLSVVADWRTSGRFVTASLMASSSEIFSTSGGGVSAVSVGMISTARKLG